MHAGSLASGDGARDSCAVEPLLTDDDELALAALARTPGAVELMLQPLADTLDQQAHRSLTTATMRLAHVYREASVWSAAIARLT